ncbi:unnamed protein product, partial [Prorocentrum cordatum]
APRGPAGLRPGGAGAAGGRAGLHRDARAAGRRGRLVRGGPAEVPRGGLRGPRPAAQRRQHAVAALMDGTVALSPAGGRPALAALRPLALRLAGDGGLTVHSISSVLAAHAHLAVRDADLIEQMSRGAALAPEGKLPAAVVGRLLVSCGALGAPLPEALLRHVEAELLRLLPRMPLDAVARVLLATALAGFQHFSAGAVDALVARAGSLCEGAVVAKGAACALAASAHARWDGRGPLPQLARVASDHAHRLDPPPPQGLLREVFRGLLDAVDGAEVAADVPAHGFHAADALHGRGRARPLSRWTARSASITAEVPASYWRSACSSSARWSASTARWRASEGWVTERVPLLATCLLANVR